MLHDHCPENSGGNVFFFRVAPLSGEFGVRSEFGKFLLNFCISLSVYFHVIWSQNVISCHCHCHFLSCLKDFFIELNCVFTFRQENMGETEKRFSKSDSSYLGGILLKSVGWGNLEISRPIFSQIIWIWMRAWYTHIMWQYITASRLTLHLCSSGIEQNAPKGGEEHEKILPATGNTLESYQQQSATLGGIAGTLKR